MIRLDDIGHPNDVFGALDAHLVRERHPRNDSRKGQEAYMVDAPHNVDQAVQINALVHVAGSSWAGNVERITRLPEGEMAGEISLKFIQLQVESVKPLLLLLVRVGLGDGAAIDVLAADFREADPLYHVGCVGFFYLVVCEEGLLPVAKVGGYVAWLIDGHLPRIHGVDALLRTWEESNIPWDQVSPDRLIHHCRSFYLRHLGS